MTQEIYAEELTKGQIFSFEEDHSEADIYLVGDDETDATLICEHTPAAAERVILNEIEGTHVYVLDPEEIATHHDDKYYSGPLPPEVHDWKEV